jgi:ubiquinone biosynthesis protein
VPFERIREEIDHSLRQAATPNCSNIRSRAGRRGLDRAGPPRRTTDGREVAVKVLRPGIREQFARDIETYEWAAAHLEALGGEAARLRPRLVIANLKRWTLRELDLRREAASASELKPRR